MGVISPDRRRAFILYHPFAHVPSLIAIRRDLAVRAALLIGLGPRLRRRFKAA